MVEVKALSHMDYAISYELTTESGGQSNDFAIDSRSGVVDLLRTLDYETDPVEYHLRVKAIENRRQPVTSTVNVRSFRRLHSVKIISSITSLCTELYSRKLHRPY